MTLTGSLAVRPAPTSTLAASGASTSRQPAGARRHPGARTCAPQRGWPFSSCSLAECRFALSSHETKGRRRQQARQRLAQLSPARPRPALSSSPWWSELNRERTCVRHEPRRWSAPWPASAWGRSSGRAHLSRPACEPFALSALGATGSPHNLIRVEKFYLLHYVGADRSSLAGHSITKSPDRNR